MMATGSFWNDLEDEVCGDFFNHIDELLDFPNDDSEGGQEEEENNLPVDAATVTTATDSVNVSDVSTFSGNSSFNSEEDLAAGLAVPCEDLDQLEWLSTFVEDSFSAASYMPLKQDQGTKAPQFQSSSPISVLEEGSLKSKPLVLGVDAFVPGRARSKRPRPPAFIPRSPSSLFLFSPTSSDHIYGSGGRSTFLITAADYPPQLEDFAESDTPEEKPKKKKKKKKPSLQFGSSVSCGPVSSQTPRKCMHCEIQKTPQWRAGPLGPKTLCNACGVRYKSGRLYPEYRPAASPTFVASVHSNSHKKVVEMRSRSGKMEPAPIPKFTRKHGHSTDSESCKQLVECDV